MGMTLRDYFAGQIIFGLVTYAPGFLGAKTDKDNYTPYAKSSCNYSFAERAYVLAGDMLKAREEKIWPIQTSQWATRTTTGIT